MPRDIYVYEFIIYPTIQLKVTAGFSPEQIAGLIEKKYTRKFFLEDGKEIFINLASVKSFKLLSKEPKHDCKN